TLHRQTAIGPASVLVASVIVFSLINPRFLNATNLSLLIQQAAVLATLAIGQTMIILTAGIDLSVGAAAILAQMVMAQTAANNGVPGVLAIILGIAVGALTGFINGFLVTRIKLPPFIVTLGTLSIYTAIGLRYSGGASVYASAMPNALIWTGNYVNIGPYQLTTGVILMLVLYVIGGTSLFGGRGAVLGTLFGALIVQVFQSGISLAGVQSLYQVLAEGILVIVAVALDQWIRRVRR